MAPPKPDPENPTEKTPTGNLGKPPGRPELTSSRDPKKADQRVLFEPQPAPDYKLATYLDFDAHGETLSGFKRWLRAKDDPFLIITGPEASGKTHLARCLPDLDVGTASFHASADVKALTKELAANNGNGEDFLIIDPVNPERLEPRDLVALIEHCRYGAARLILIGRGPVDDWAGDLRDLRTRLQAMSRLDVPVPAEAMLEAMIARYFQVRQFLLPPEASHQLARYIAPRIARSFPAAAATVHAIDLLALARGRKPSVTLAREVLEPEAG